MSFRTYPIIPDGLPAPRRPISFVCVQFCNEYKHNILTSDAVHDPLNQFIHVDNRQNLFFNTLGAAICHGLAQAKHDLVAVVHEDVVLPKNWQARFEASLRALEAEDPNWALLGAVGWDNDKRPQGHWSDPHTHKNTFETVDFAPVSRLDEQLLILRKAGPVQFDPDLPSIHNIGRDLARAGQKHGCKTYAIHAPTIHKYADAKGVLVQNREDSPKIKDRKSRTYLADRACSDAYLAHKWGDATPSQTPQNAPALSPQQSAILDAPIILLGRGGGGTRLLSTMARDCGLFIGNNVNGSGDCLDMVPEIYTSVFRRHQSRDPWLQAQSPPALQAAAAAMLDTAGWPETWGFKLPESLLVLPDIMQAFPKARFIELTRNTKTVTQRRTHMTARIGNHIGRTALRLAYDHLSLPRSNILRDGDQSRMVATTLHQTALAQQYLRPLPAARYLQLRLEDTITAPEVSLARFAAFSGLPARSNRISEVVDSKRAAAATATLNPDEQRHATDMLARLQIYQQLRHAVPDMRPIFVLGMHRSGTSSLTGSLEAAGLYLGNTAHWATDNRKGNRENPVAMEINTQLLAAQGKHWKIPPTDYPLAWPRAQRNARDILLTGCPSDRPWGLKDPRLLLTLEGWQQALPNLRLIGTFRHPEAVAQSLLLRNQIPLQEGRTLWRHYNTRLLEFYDTAPFPLIDFDLPPTEYHAAVAQACQGLGLELPEESAAFFDPALRHTTLSETAIEDGETQTIYAALKARALGH